MRLLHRNLKLFPLAILAVPVGAVLAPAAGYAQQTPDEIIVSVRRRDESLQEVPLSVSTIGAEQIERLGINNVADVVQYTAGLEFDEGFGAQDTRITIRGLSPTRGRSNVAFLVDGVDFTGEAVSTAGGGVFVNQRLLDVERVEVVKGPQSALYGRSAFAGAIQYVTKKPSLEESEGSISYQASGDGDGALGGSLSAAFGGPITDTFGLRVNGTYYNEDGYYRNSITGQRVGDTDGYGLALGGLWQPNDDVSINGRIAYSHDEIAPRAQARVASNALIDIDESLAVQNGETPSLIRTSGLGFLLNTFYPECGPAPTPAAGTLGSCLGAPKLLTVGTMPDADQLQVVLSDDPRTGGDYPGTSVDTFTANFSVVVDREKFQFGSYTGLARVDSKQFFDGQWDALPPGSYSSLDGSYNFTLADCGFGDCSPAGQEIGFNNESRLFSQEFRVSTKIDGPVNFTVGALLWKEWVNQVEFGSTISPAIFRAVPLGPPGPPPVQSVPPANANMPNVNTPQTSLVGRNTESKSIYGLVEWDINEVWKLSLEARRVWEDLTVNGPLCDVAATEALSGLTNNTFPQFCADAFRGASSVGIADGTGTLPQGTYTKAIFLDSSASFQEAFTAPKATLEFTPSDTQLFYASVAKGVKPGGISTITAGSFFNPEANTFDKEKLLAYELGSKSTLLGGRLLVNGALFYQEYTDKQVGVSRFDPVISTDVGSIENAGEAEIWGVELEALWQVTDNFSLAAGYTWLDAEYTDFAVLTTSTNNIARSLAAGGQGCLTLVPDPDVPAAVSCLVSFTGNKVEDIPEHSFVGNARYEAPLGNGSTNWYTEATVIYTDSRFMDEFNVKELDSYWLLNARAGLITDRWDLTLFMDNVLDDDTVRSGVDFGSQVNTVRQGQFPPGPTDGVIVSLPDPRVIGVRGVYRF